MIYKEYYLDTINNNIPTPGEENTLYGQSFNTTGRCHRRSRCKKPTCIYCGGKNNLIHKKRLGAILRRINALKIKQIRYFVFTLPPEVRNHFCNTHGLNQFFNLVLRLIKQFFGEEISRRDSARGIEKTYSLRKEAFATLHLHGEDGCDYHPHINVIIFEENLNVNLFLSIEKITAICESFRKGLEGICNVRIKKAVSNYKYCLTEKDCAYCIRYVATPPDPIKLAHLFEDCLSEEDFKNFRFIRFWGKLSNSEYNHSSHKYNERIEIDFNSPKTNNLKSANLEENV